MKDYQAITNSGRVIPVRARSENGAWRAALALSGSEWIVELRYKA
jgi:hypothetical protein